MAATDSRSTETKRVSLAESIAKNGPMDERRAMEIAGALCSRLIDENEVTEADLRTVHPNSILLSSEGTISFSGDPVPESAREAYLPPEYEKGSPTDEGVVIYGLGILLLFLVTGQEKKSGLDGGVRNRTLRSIISRCTALDSRRRYKSLLEVRSALKSELVFPMKRVRRAAVAAVLCVAAAASFYLYRNGKEIGEARGRAEGFRTGYSTGYETGVTDAPGIGIENSAAPDGLGNLPGNLNSENGAFAVMGGGRIYYTSDGRLYRMDPYTRDIELLAEHRELSSLNFWQGYLFYLTEDSVVRMDAGTGQEEPVSDRIRGRFCICDGTLFVDDEKNTGYLYGIDAATLEARQLNSVTAYDYLNAADGKLYFADPRNGSRLFRSDYDGGNVSRLLSRACRDVELCGDRVYCLTTDDLSEGRAEILVRMDTAGGELEVLTARPVLRYIAEENGIFYIPADSGYLEWMTPDGKTQFTVCASSVTDINIAGRWIFYRISGDDALYRMRIDGSDSDRLR